MIGVLKRIASLRQQALSHKAFGEKNKMNQCYKEREKLIKKYGKPKLIKVVNGRKKVVYSIGKKRFNINIDQVEDEIKDRLQGGKIC